VWHQIARDGALRHGKANAAEVLPAEGEGGGEAPAAV
jgi:hypothetical protein